MDARSRSRLYSTTTVTYDFLQQALGNYFGEASISLIFLNNVSTVEVYRRYPRSPGLHRMWEVTVARSPSPRHPRATDLEVKSVIYRELQQIDGGGSAGRTDRCRRHVTNWLVVYSNTEKNEVPEEMLLFGEKHGLKARCAIAAPASARSDHHGMLFMGVPTEQYLSLPVHISAVSTTTLVSGLRTCLLICPLCSSFSRIWPAKAIAEVFLWMELSGTSGSAKTGSSSSMLHS